MKLEIEREARAENLPAFRGFIEEACREAGIPATDGFELKLAVDEACTNILEHGYGAGASGPIRVSFDSNGERVVVVITDRARPFAPQDAPLPDLASSWKDRKVGGLGWHLVWQTVDEIGYQPRSGGGNRLTLIKHLTSGSKPSGE